MSLIGRHKELAVVREHLRAGRNLAVFVIISDSDNFYSYQKPADFRLERREVQVFSTREVPDLRLEEKVRGSYADFLRFTSPA